MKNKTNVIRIGLMLCAAAYMIHCGSDDVSQKTPQNNNTVKSEQKHIGITDRKTDSDKPSASNAVPGVKKIEAIPMAKEAPARLGAGSRINVGDDARSFQAKTFDGKDINLEDYKGKIILLDFWATWCRPCMAEMPYISKIAGTYKDSKDFAIIGISLDRDVEAVKSYVSKNGLTYPHVFDGKDWKSAVAQQYGVFQIPFTVLIGKDSKVLKVGLRGEELVSEIGKVVGGSTAG
jgi:peroxiredoxin